MDKVMIFDVQRSSFVDGPGIRTTVFFKGCNMRCKWCHNPESQNPKKQMLFYADKCTHCGKCLEVCPNHLEKCTFCGKCALYCSSEARRICGEEKTADEIFAIIKSDKSFYDASGGGATFSGGECMLYTDFLLELLEKCRADGIHTAVDTAGNVPWKCFEKVIPYTDLFLYDIKCITPSVHRDFTGADNALLLENYKRLLDADAEIIVRVPMIPECNANDEEFEKIADFLHRYPPKKAELLPYHSMGEGKYRALGLGEPQIFTVPSETSMKKFKNMIGDLL